MIGRLLKESVISSSGRCRNVMELLVKKQGVKSSTAKEPPKRHLTDGARALIRASLCNTLGGCHGRNGLKAAAFAETLMRSKLMWCCGFPHPFPAGPCSCNVLSVLGES